MPSIVYERVKRIKINRDFDFVLFVAPLMDYDNVVVLDIDVDRMDLEEIIAFVVSYGDSMLCPNCQYFADLVAVAGIGLAGSRDYCCYNLLAFVDTFLEVDYQCYVILEIVAAVDVNEASNCLWAMCLQTMPEQAQVDTVEVNSFVVIMIN
jgi:hypothetical protein